MPGSGFDDGARQFGDLARNLRLVGETELRRELYKAISDAARPLAAEIKSAAHLDPYLPDRYAAVLARDLSVTTHKRTGGDPGVTITARAPTANPGGRGRQIRSLNDAGILRHPVFADRTAPRRTWEWKDQTRGVRLGFFDDPCQAAAPRIRDAIAAAVARVEEKAMRGI
jgi:hypothetical protein